MLGGPTQPRPHLPSKVWTRCPHILHVSQARPSHWAPPQSLLLTPTGTYTQRGAPETPPTMHCLPRLPLVSMWPRIMIQFTGSQPPLLGRQDTPGLCHAGVGTPGGLPLARAEGPWGRSPHSSLLATALPYLGSDDEPRHREDGNLPGAHRKREVRASSLGQVLVGAEPRACAPHSCPDIAAHGHSQQEHPSCP